MTIKNNIAKYFTNNASNIGGQYFIPPLNIEATTSSTMQNPLFSFQNFNEFPTFNFGQNQTFSPFGNLNAFMTPMPDYTQMFSNLINMYNNAVQNFQQIDISKMFSPAQTTYSDKDTSNFSYDSKELKERWSKKKPNLSDEFYNKVVEISKRLNCDPNDLMALMNAESGLNPKAKNRASSATGLIQFIESTAKELGTSTAELKKMSAEEQLVYVEKYLQNAKKKANLKDNDKVTAGTLYAMVFLPSRASQNIITESHENYYQAGDNENLDLNKDGKITKNELGQKIKNFMA